MEHLTGGEVGVVGAILVSLMALIGWLIRNLMRWMQGKIDQKNGQINELIADQHRLIEAMVRGETAQTTVKDMQGKFLSELREICEKRDTQFCQLMERIEKAMER